MGDLLTTGSVLTAFFAGGVALFAPCCIVFLAPSYMAAATKNRRWRLLPLTFTFAAGLALVLVPVTVGVSLVSSSIANYHVPLYYAGGALMLALAALALSGRMMTLPAFLRTPDTSRGETAGFFGLGVFSGIASSCCAPVLAGVMALSVLSGSVPGAVTLGLAFTFGMTFPLFVMALLWDRYRLGERGLMRAKPVKIRVPGAEFATNTVNLAVAVVFAGMGGFVLYLAGSGTMTKGPGFQVELGRGLGWLLRGVDDALAPVPEALLGLGLLGLASVFVIATLRNRDRPERDDPDLDESHPPGCEHTAATSVTQ